MIIINNDIFLSFGNLVAAGFIHSTITCAKQRNSSGWQFIPDPTDGRKVLISYEALKPRNKKKVTDHYGDPYEYHGNASLRDAIKCCKKDRDLINNEYLGEITDACEKGIRAAGILLLLSKTNTEAAKQMGFSKIGKFTEAVLAIIKAEKLPLPTSYQKLKAKVRQYKSVGGQCVISKKRDNTNAVKLCEEQMSLIKQIYGLPNHYGIAYITEKYNEFATKRNWPQLSRSTLQAYIKSPGIRKQIQGMREGEKHWKNKNHFIIPRIRPGRPMLLCVGDATPFELFYKERREDARGHQVMKYGLRKVVYVIIDAYNDYVLGFAIGNTETGALAVHAWANSCMSHGALPWEVKSDRFGGDALKALYPKLTGDPNFVSLSKVGNPRDKVIEPFFKQFNEQIAREQYNWGGVNLTAKQESQANSDFLNKTKKLLPDEAGVIQQITDCLNEWNNRPRKKLNGKSLKEQWYEAFNALEEKQIRRLDPVYAFQVFGKETGRPNTLTNEGIVVTIEGTERKYMDFDSPKRNEFWDSIGTTYKVRYFPHDLNKILVTSVDRRKSFILKEIIPAKMSKLDQGEGDRANLNMMLNFQDTQEQRMIDLNTEERKMIESDAALKAMYIDASGVQKLDAYTAENNLKELPASTRVLPEAPKKKRYKAKPFESQEEDDVWDLG